MRTRSLTFALLMIGLAAAFGMQSADAVHPPRSGSVTCGANGSVAFARSLQFAAGHKPNGDPKPDPDSRIVFRNDPAGCSGTQTGGNPRHPGAISSGRIVAKGFSSGHTCSALTAHGVHDVKAFATWFDASGTKLGVTKIVGAAVTVSGLGNGVPSNFPPPNNPSPGIVTFALTGTASATSSAFPDEVVHATFIADQTTDAFPLPCSRTSAPLPLSLTGFTFSGVNGPSTLSIS